MNSQTNPCLVVLCTCPDDEVAAVLGRRLVEEALAACVNVVPGIRSIYRWRGETHEDNEVLLVIKTRTNLYGQLEQAIINAHPYELPEIIAVPIERGFKQYLAWIDEHTAS